MDFNNKAIEFYEKHKQRVRKYNDNNRDKINSAMKLRYEILKQNQEKYKIYLEKKKQYYQNKKTYEHTQITQNNPDNLDA